MRSRWRRPPAPSVSSGGKTRPAAAVPPSRTTSAARRRHRASRHEDRGLRLVKHPADAVRRDLRPAPRELVHRQPLGRDAKAGQGRERLALEAVGGVREPGHAALHHQAFVRGLLELPPLRQRPALPARVELVRSVGRSRDARVTARGGQRRARRVLVHERDIGPATAQPERRPGPHHPRAHHRDPRATAHAPMVAVAAGRLRYAYADGRPGRQLRSRCRG